MTTHHLPNLVIIGAMKCATTSLHRYLNLHPEISMSVEKEPDFFVDRWQDRHDMGFMAGKWGRGLEWYRSNFRGKATVYGEASVNYSKHPHIQGVPGRMHAVIPNAKIIYLVRNPVERIVSHYVHYLADGWGEESLEDLLGDVQNSYYVNCSRYYRQIQQFLPFYPRNRIMVVQSEEMSCRRTETLHNIFEFVGVESNFVHEGFFTTHQPPNSKVRLSPLGRFLEKHIAASPELLPVVDHIQNTEPWLLGSQIQRPVLPDRLKKKIITALYDDIRQLEDFTGWNLSAWIEQYYGLKEEDRIQNTGDKKGNYYNLKASPVGI